MDAVITILVAIYWALIIKKKKASIVYPPVASNDSFFRDEEAFTEIFKEIVKSEDK